MSLKKRYQAGEFKTHCLRIMDEVSKGQREVEIFKRNEPMVRIIPAHSEPRPFFGCMEGSVEIHEEIIEGLDETWDAEA